MGVLKTRRPVPEGFVHRVFEGSTSRRNRYHLGSVELHPEHVWMLSPYVHFAHVHTALKTEFRAGRGGGDSVLSRPRLRDDTGFSHASGKQGLPEGVVDLVGAGARQSLKLDVDLCPSDIPAAVFSVEQRGGATG